MVSFERAATDWRISCAHIQTDSGFSSYHGVDRSLLITSGEGVMLTVNHQTPFAFTPCSAPYSFTGEDRVHAQLLNGAVEDFNVMTRRNRWLHTLERQCIQGSCHVFNHADVLLIYHARGGELVCDDGVAQHTVLKGELLVSSALELQLQTSSGSDSDIYIVRLQRQII
ncbi:HutD/Ves family protein [Hydromonas duriensis]|uniref:HutD protein n=1 Tax=Hydromonas duriensis TaxID=1527608 RepID=A0A4V3DK63_9BURK|nr:HutD family protein [Hydromonas duriensis]TDR32857.1 hypothetical protein DFR44_102156 [Hydromonas duriensis]